MDHIIRPAERLSGSVRLQGDKSISHRALMIGAMADGVTRIENLSEGQDVQSTVSCLCELGVKIKKEQEQLLVYGSGINGFRQPVKSLNVGNSGTTIRLLAGILAGQPFASTITGDESIQRRPMSRVVQPLQRMGAEIQAVNGEYAPLSIKGGNLKSIAYDLPVASAQVKSCLLFAGLYAEGKTEIREPIPSRDHTELMLHNFGAMIYKEGTKLSIVGRSKLSAREIFVPGDLSSAAFLIAAATVVPNSKLELKNVGINPTRKAFLDTLLDMGADLEIVNVVCLNNEMMADIIVRSGALKGVKIDSAVVPQIIDEIPILAVLATQAEGTTEIRQAGELRHKECDRLHALNLNLSRMGAEVQELEDGLIVHGPARLRPAEIESFKDHRIAMAFAVAGLISGGEIIIRDADCVNVSFPGFFKIVTQLTVAGFG